MIEYYFEEETNHKVIDCYNNLKNKNYLEETIPCPKCGGNLKYVGFEYLEYYQSYLPFRCDSNSHAILDLSGKTPYANFRITYNNKYTNDIQSDTFEEYSWVNLLEGWRIFKRDKESANLESGYRKNHDPLQLKFGLLKNKVRI